MLIGRIFLGAIFIWSSFDKIVDFRLYEGLLNTHGVHNAFLFVIGAMAVEFFGGLALMLGLFARFAAFILMIYMVPATFIFHDFWIINEAAEKHLQTILFFKNIAIFGGLLYVLACGPGRFHYGKHKHCSKDLPQ
jgi:putative oxidoreductase